MRKMLRLGDMGGGGRQRHQLHDLLGIRAIVVPRSDLEPSAAEAAAQKVNSLQNKCGGQGA